MYIECICTYVHVYTYNHLLRERETWVVLNRHRMKKVNSDVFLQLHDNQSVSNCLNQFGDHNLSFVPCNRNRLAVCAVDFPADDASAFFCKNFTIMRVLDPNCEAIHISLSPSVSLSVYMYIYIFIYIHIYICRCILNAYVHMYMYIHITIY